MPCGWGLGGRGFVSPHGCCSCLLGSPGSSWLGSAAGGRRASMGKGVCRRVLQEDGGRGTWSVGLEGEERLKWAKAEMRCTVRE